MLHGIFQIDKQCDNNHKTGEALLVSKSGRIYLVRLNHIRSILPTSRSLAILCGQNRPDMIDSAHITKCSNTRDSTK